MRERWARKGNHGPAFSRHIIVLLTVIGLSLPFGLSHMAVQHTLTMEVIPGEHLGHYLDSTRAGTYPGAHSMVRSGGLSATSIDSTPGPALTRSISTDRSASAIHPSHRLGGVETAPNSVLPSVRTLVLANNSLFDGNFVPQISGHGPVATSYDPATGDIYLVDSDTGNTIVLDPSRSELVAEIPRGGSPNGIAYDSVNNEFFLANDGSRSVSVINASTNRVIADVPVGIGPAGIAYDRGNGCVYVVNRADLNVSVFNASTLRAVATIALGGTSLDDPYGAVYDPSNGYIYVSYPGYYGSGKGGVSVIDGATNRLLTTIPLGANNPDPGGLAFDPINGYVYVANEPWNLTSIDGATNTVVGSVRVGADPASVTYDPTNHDLYVPNSGSNNVTVVNATSFRSIATVAVGGAPSDVAYDPTSRLLYVANAVSNSVSVVNATTNLVVSTINFGGRPYVVAQNPATADVWVGSTGPYNASVINGSTNRISGGAPADYGFQGLAFDPAHGELYVASGDHVTVLRSSDYGVVASISMNGCACGIAYDPRNGQVYVSDWIDPHLPGVVHVVNTTTHSIVAGISVGQTPFGLLYDPHNRNLYVDNEGWGSDLGSVSVINGSTNSVTATIKVGPSTSGFALDSSSDRLYVGFDGDRAIVIVNVGNNSLWGTVPVNRSSSLAYDPANDEVFVARASLGEVAILDGSAGQLIGTVAVGRSPQSISYDPANQLVYVSNYNSGTVSILSSLPANTYVVSFLERGLPVGTSWSMTLNGETRSTTSNAIQFLEGNGTDYWFSVGQVPGYKAHPAIGTIDVVGAPRVQLIHFTPHDADSGKGENGERGHPDFGRDQRGFSNGDGRHHDEATGSTRYGG